MSTQKAAEILGFKVMTFNTGQDFWAWGNWKTER